MFTVYWLGGKRQLITGDSIADAFTKAGYGNGALAAVDFYANGDDKEYTWDADKRYWVSNRTTELRSI